MVIQIEGSDKNKVPVFEGFLSESDYQGYATTAKIETQANGGVVLLVAEEDEFGHDFKVRIVLDPEDIRMINAVKS